MALVKLRARLESLKLMRSAESAGPQAAPLVEVESVALSQHSLVALVGPRGQELTVVLCRVLCLLGAQRA